MTGAFGGTHLKASDLLWGPHSIDHFAYYSNTKLLRFNSRIQNPGSEGIESFVYGMGRDNNFVFPPVVLFRECNYCKASGTVTVIIAVWHPAPFWRKISLAGIDFFCLRHQLDRYSVN